jgi:superfamily II RNA helicase
MTAEGDEYERVPGVIYWGCESTFHMMCIEADQRPSKREWETVIDYVNANPEEAAKSAVMKQGSLKLTPLVSTIRFTLNMIIYTLHIHMHTY